MSIERGLVALMLAGVFLALLGIYRWLTLPRALVVPDQAAASAIKHRPPPPPPTAPVYASIAAPVIAVVAAPITAPVDELADYYDKLRKQVHWVPTRLGRQTKLAPDMASRMLLAKSAAERAHLAEVGLNFRDVYAIINAETSWVPRAGASRNGTPNVGIAQFEPATAKALGLRNPNDVVEAVHAAAVHIKEAALWSQDRLRGIKLDPAEHARKLREGISIYYNLSTRGRNQWNGFNTAALPVQTQRHIANARFGAQEAAVADARQSRIASSLPSHHVRVGMAPAPADALSAM